ncbi:MAG TPA: TIGR03435 family protein [Candidatus Sulfopaludibacter sp.]|jgi:uncharacterized protein (TIGR03435 family)|nr:TIGR03435 family protein [Candidatus Sulfopaludibacter sp.]
MLNRMLPFVLAAGLAAAQTASTDDLRFEVASLKPSLPNPQGGGIVRPKPANNGYLGTNVPLRTYLMIAFTVRDTQISGAPSWFAEDRFDLDANADKQYTNDELHVMLQHLLEDRCHLKFHRETKEQSGYALVVDKGGPKFTEHDPPSMDHPPIAPAGPGKIQATNVAMDYLALFLTRVLDQPVVNKTGLKSFYDFKLEFVPERAGGPDGPNPIDGPTLFEALKLQLGLRLEATKATTEKIVIDHLEKPTAN